jgi:hypothetical protein
MSEPNGPPKFKVVLAHYLKDRANQLHDAALEQGLGTRFIEALKVIDQAYDLVDPRSWLILQCGFPGSVQKKKGRVGMGGDSHRDPACPMPW